ncbi:MAG: glycosyltransferase family 39 protein [Synergistaceae bacterium]|nr:glycosyltransferase family 39 protein [Synergistaceae bacterium]
MKGILAVKLMRNKPALLFGALLFWLYFRGIGDHGLIDPLEGINASASIHMSASGNFFVPRIGSLYLAGKTMLTWWLSALSLRLFGWGEFAVRFWSALSGLGMIWASAAAAKTSSRRSSWLAASICASFTGCFVVSQIASSHAIYSCLTAITMAGAVRSRDNKLWLIPAHVASTLAFIAHGASGLLLAWMAVIFYSVLCSDWDMLRDFFTWPPGIIITIVSAGFYLVSLIIINPELVHFLRCRNHAYTFDGIAGAAVFMFICLVPWIGFVVRAVFEVVPRKFPAEKSPELFMLVWAAVFAFGAAASGDVLSFASCVPALSAMLGRKLDVWLGKKKLRSVRISVMINVLVLVPVLYMILPFTAGIFPVVKASMLSLIPWGILTGLELFAEWYYTRTRQITKWVRNVPAAALLCLMPLAGVFNLTADAYSIREIGRRLRETVEGSETVIQYGVNYPSVYFYTFRNSRIIEAELTPGLKEKGQVAEFPLIGQLWGGKERVFLIMPEDKHPESPLPQNISHILGAEGILLLSNK